MNENEIEKIAREAVDSCVGFPDANDLLPIFMRAITRATDDLRAQLAAANERVNYCHRALKYYASPEIYIIGPWNDGPRIMYDAGNTARTALLSTPATKEEKR